MWTGHAGAQAGTGGAAGAQAGPLACAGVGDGAQGVLALGVGAGASAAGRWGGRRWGAQGERTCADGHGRARACANGRGCAQGVHAQAGTQADERGGRAAGRHAGARQARGAQPAGRPGRSLCAQAGPGWGFVHSDSVFLARFDSVVS